MIHSQLLISNILQQSPREPGVVGIPLNIQYCSVSFLEILSLWLLICTTRKGKKKYCYGCWSLALNSRIIWFTLNISKVVHSVCWYQCCQGKIRAGYSRFPNIIAPDTGKPPLEWRQYCALKRLIPRRSLHTFSRNSCIIIT